MGCFMSNKIVLQCPRCQRKHIFNTITDYWKDYKYCPYCKPQNELREMLNLINSGNSHFNINERWCRLNDMIKFRDEIKESLTILYKDGVEPLEYKRLNLNMKIFIDSKFQELSHSIDKPCEDKVSRLTQSSKSSQGFNIEVVCSKCGKGSGIYRPKEHIMHKTRIVCSTCMYKG